jgi:hypothetical protein
MAPKAKSTEGSGPKAKSTDGLSSMQTILQKIEKDREKKDKKKDKCREGFFELSQRQKDQIVFVDENDNQKMNYSQENEAWLSHLNRMLDSVQQKSLQTLKSPLKIWEDMENDRKERSVVKVKKRKISKDTKENDESQSQLSKPSPTEGEREPKRGRTLKKKKMTPKRVTTSEARPPVVNLICVNSDFYVPSSDKTLPLPPLPVAIVPQSMLPIGV